MTDTVTNQAADVQQPTEAQAPSLTLQDLILVAQIINLTSQRGAYRAEEMANVGNLYIKLIAFLTSVGAITTQPDAEPEKSND